MLRATKCLVKFARNILKIRSISLGQISPTLCSMHYTMWDNSFKRMTVYVVSCWSNLTYTVGASGVIAAAHTLYQVLSLCTRQYCWPVVWSWKKEYHIAGNFRGRKLSWISRFCGYSRKFSPRKLYFHQFAKVFSLESFPLYGTLHAVPFLSKF